MQKWIFALIYTFAGIFLIQAKEITHSVQKGETLYSISRHYGISLDDILVLNGIENPSLIKAGFVLTIPDNSETSYSEYTVDKGDTLYSIAKKHDIDVETLLNKNKLDEKSIIRIGQKLLIPVRESVSHSEVPGTVNESVSSYYWPVNGDVEKLSGKLQGSKIAAGIGDAVYSVSSGKVVWEGPYRGFGRVIFVESGTGYVYVYGGNEKINVNVGDNVKPGTMLGEIGVNVYEGKPTMFFAVYKDGKPVDVEKAPRL